MHPLRYWASLSHRVGCAYRMPIEAFVDAALGAGSDDCRVLVLLSAQGGGAFPLTGNCESRSSWDAKQFGTAVPRLWTNQQQRVSLARTTRQPFEFTQPPKKRVG